MRAILSLATAAALLALGSGVAVATPLPAPPYAADDSQAAPNSGYQSLDRYGGGGHRDDNRQAQAGQGLDRQGEAPAASPAPGRYIGWSGKVEAQAEAGQAAPQTGGWAAMTRRWDDPTLAQTRQAAASAASYQPAPYRVAAAPANPSSSSLWRPISRQDLARAQPRPAPTSIYDPPPPTAATQTDPAYPPPPVRMAQNTQGQNTQGQNTQGQAPSSGPRFYSLHRDYGLQPDAIPLPPQFFGPTADLSAPPADPTVKRVTNASGQTHNVVVDDQGAQ
jgi:hypothetical protein